MRREELPENIRKTVLNLEAELNTNVSILKEYKGMYYAYSSTYVINKETGRKEYIVRYIGRIDQNGDIQRPKKKTVEIETEKNIPEEVKSTIKKLKEQNNNILILPDSGMYHVYERNEAQPIYLGYVNMEGKFISSGNAFGLNINNSSNSIPKYNGTMDDVDASLLKSLSMNGRIPLPYAAELAGINASKAYHKIKSLEKAFGIRYIAELDLEVLGYSEYICFIKFSDIVPSNDEITRVFSADPSVQFVATVKGEYDIMAYILAKSNDEIATIAYHLKSTTLQRYASYWHIAPFKSFYGYIPVRDEFFDIIEKDKAWSRSKESGHIPEDKIYYNYYVVLRDLNINGNSEFKDIDERNKLGENRASYAYKALIERFRALKRITITMHNAPVRYFSVIFMDTIEYDKLLSTRKELMSNIMEKGSLTDKYALVGDIQTPYGEMFIAPIYTSNGLESITKKLKTDVKGINIRTLIITDILIGRLCLRIFDNAYSEQAKAIEYMTHIHIDKIDYKL